MDELDDCFCVMKGGKKVCHGKRCPGLCTYSIIIERNFTINVLCSQEKKRQKKWENLMTASV